MSQVVRSVVESRWFKSLKAPGESAWSSDYVITLNFMDGAGPRHFHNQNWTKVFEEAAEELRQHPWTKGE